MANDVEYKLSLNDKFSSGLNNANNSVNKFEGSIGSVAKGLVALEAIRFGANIGKQIVQLGSDAEQTQVAFSTMLGTDTQANNLIDQLNKLASITPFTSKTVKDGAKQLLAYGVGANDVIPTLKMLGDISSGVGMDKMPNLVMALGQVKAATKLTGMELRQFTEAGVPMLEYLSKTSGKSVKQLQKDISAGAVSYDMVTKALASATGEGGKFFNLMQKQSETTGGLWSTFEDKLELTGTELGKRLNPAAKSVTKGLISMADAAMNYVRIKPAEAIEEERKNVNALALELSSSNTTLARRNEIYNYLKKEHPEIVKGLSKENIETSKLAANMAEYNKNALNRIIIAKLTDKEQQAMADTAKWTDRMADAQLRLSQIIGEVSPEIAFSQQTFGAKANKTIAILRKEVDQQIALGKAGELVASSTSAGVATTVDTRTKEQKQLADMLIMAGQYNLALKNHNRMQGDVNSIRRRNAILKKQFGIVDEALGGKTLDATVTPDKNLEDSITTLKSAAPKTFNINIQTLIDKFTISTTTLKEATPEIKAQVINALAEALADVKAQTNA